MGTSTIGNFPDESFQAIDCTDTDNSTQNNQVKTHKNTYLISNTLRQNGRNEDHAGAVHTVISWATFTGLWHGCVSNKITSKLFQPLSMSVWNNSISALGNLPEIISELVHRLIILTNVFRHVHLNNFEMILESFGGWNNFISVSDVVTREIKQ